MIGFSLPTCMSQEECTSRSGQVVTGKTSKIQYESLEREINSFSSIHF